jgi:hypothetical protein
VHNGRFIISTNDNALNQKIISVDPLNPEPENWKTIVAEKPE